MINKKEVMQIAMANIKYDTPDPYQAILDALETWLVKKNYMLIPVLPKGQQNKTTGKG